MVVSGVPTTAPFHILILENEAFKAGDVDTGFIVKHADSLKVRAGRAGSLGIVGGCMRQAGCRGPGGSWRLPGLALPAQAWLARGGEGRGGVGGVP